jgi:uncharacterized protein HemX
VSDNLEDVAAGGDTIATLEAMRQRIAADIDTCDNLRDKSALYLRLEAVLKTIAELRPPAQEGDSVDEIAARRAARRASAAPGKARTNRSG